MSFGKSKYQTPKNPLLPRQSPSSQIQHPSPTTTEPSSMLYQKYGKRLSVIQQNLNAICSQHDALMPLLTLLDTMPQLSKSEQQIRAATKRVAEFEGKLARLEEVHEEYKAKETMGSAEESFAVISRGVLECKEQVNGLVGGARQNGQTNPEEIRGAFTQPLTNQAQARMEASRRQLQIMLAQFRNEIQLSYKKTLQQCRSKPFTTPQLLKLLPHPPLQTLQSDLKNLHRQIQMIKIQLPSAPLVEFHNYNFSRINYELYEIQQIVDGLYGKTGKQLEEAAKSAGDFKERVEWLGWQVRGLRKKYLREVSEGGNRGKGQEEQQLAHDLGSLERRHQGLMKKIMVLVESLKEKTIVAKTAMPVPQRTDDRSRLQQH